MANVFTAAVFSLVSLLNAAGMPEERPASLPADGCWVRYFVTMNREGSDNETTMKRTYALVGTTTENEQKCRWVEMKTVQEMERKEQIDVVKFLIPEKALLEREKPLESLLRAWRKIDGGAIEEQKFNQPLGAAGMVASADFAWGRDMVIFPGPLRRTMAVKEDKVVEYQQGRLEIGEGRTGRHVVTRQALSVVRRYTITFDFTVWNHPGVALGFAAAKTRLEFLVDDVARFAETSEWVIEDFGTDAKTELPDNS
jgi:hypothetical protein